MPRAAPETEAGFSWSEFELLAPPSEPPSDEALDLAEAVREADVNDPGPQLASDCTGNDDRGQSPAPPSPPTNVAPNHLLAVLSAYVRQRVAGRSL